MKHYDVIVIGGGPAGYVAAIRGAQLGLSAAIVEKEEVGGLCLNWGCIPSKSLLRNAEVLALMRRSTEFGISFDNLTFDYGKAVERSRQVVRRLVTGLKSLMKRYDIDIFSGLGTAISPRKVLIKESGIELEAENIILATGAINKNLPSLPIDGKNVISTREALELKTLPEQITIVGGGAAGVEFAYLWSTYGCQVTLIELMPNILPNEEEEISKVLEKAFEKQGINLMTGSKVQSYRSAEGVGHLIVSQGSESTEIKSDIILVAVGLTGNVEGSGVEELGIKTNRGFVTIDEAMRTNIPGIFAIGDLTGCSLLAHAAFAQGNIAIETIAGHQTNELNYENIPRATYCQPQVASIGLTEAQAIEAGYDVKIGRFPFLASGKAQGMGDREGLVKVVSNAEYGEILGAHMVGPEVTELLGEVSVAQTLDGTVEDLGMAIHPHPTLSEALKESALSSLGMALHV